MGPLPLLAPEDHRRIGRVGESFACFPRAAVPLVALNVLNVADAAFTMWWIALGIAVEGNPVVVAIGFPAKVLGVAVVSYVAYRLRPRWLWVPTVALAAVCTYHVVGSMIVLAV